MIRQIAAFLGLSRPAPDTRNLPRVIVRFSASGRLIEISGKNQTCRT